MAKPSGEDIVGNGLQGLNTAQDEELRYLWTPELEPLFWSLTRLHVTSAWLGHVPFAHWVVRAAVPRTLVELGAHAGVSYSAFCEAVLQLRLDTHCYAVDTWTGDAHAGSYADDIYRDLQRFHQERYGAFSTLVRRRFDDALPLFPDGSVDLLHIDGYHTYEAVKHDFESWQPKLSERAVVLFHDTAEREKDFGVWRFWEEVTRNHPGFEFLHSHGLGVLAKGAAAPPEVLALCRLRDPGKVNAVRARFAFIGEHWAALRNMEETSENLAQQLRLKAAQELKKVRDEAERRIEAARLGAGQRSRSALPSASAGAEAAGAPRRAANSGRPNWRGWLRSHMGFSGAVRTLFDFYVLFRSPLFDRKWYAQQYPQRARRIPELDYLMAGAAKGWDPGPRFDSSWYLETNPDVAASRINPLVHYLRRGEAEGRPPRQEILPIGAIPVPTAPSAGPPDPSLRILYVSGEPETPGHSYRVLRPVAAAVSLGASARWIRSEELSTNLDAIAEATLVVFWRVPCTSAVRSAIEVARARGARVVLDIDDLLIDPQLASSAIIDGIRTQGDITEKQAEGQFLLMQQTMRLADFCVVPTEELAAQIRRFDRPALVVPNGFDENTFAASRLAARRREATAAAADGLVRLGYASGTRTHQRDFAAAAEAVAQLLAEHPECRLVLFRNAQGQPLTDIDEFPALKQRSGQVEWRPRVPLAQLPEELARLDINLAPLETGNIFCEAKSELKFFEAALVDVPTVASPTGPFERAIRHGETGLLAGDGKGWYQALSLLIADPGLRRRMARAAQHEILWKYGPLRRIQLLDAALPPLLGDRRAAARSFELELYRSRRPCAKIQLPEAETVFVSDRLEVAEVTVLVPVSNAAQDLESTLESIQRQSLAALDVVVVDDRSLDNSLELAVRWAEQNRSRFNRILVLRNQVTAGMAASRNAGFDAAETRFVLSLDAGCRLLPGASELSLNAIKSSGAAFTYAVRNPDGAGADRGRDLAMDLDLAADRQDRDIVWLVAKEAWAAAQGFGDAEEANSNLAFRRRLAELGLWGHHVPEDLQE